MAACEAAAAVDAACAGGPPCHRPPPRRPLCLLPALPSQRRATPPHRATPPPSHLPIASRHPDAARYHCAGRRPLAPSRSPRTVAARVHRPAATRTRQPRSAPFATRGMPEATLLPRSCLPPPLSHHALVAAPPQLRAARPPRHRPPLGAPQAPAAGHWSPPLQSSRVLAAAWRAGPDPSWIYREERGREMRTGWDPC